MSLHGFGGGQTRSTQKFTTITRGTGFAEVVGMRVRWRYNWKPDYPLFSYVGILERLDSLFNCSVKWICDLYDREVMK